VAQVVSPKDLVRGVFVAPDAKDPAAVAARMTEDVLDGRKVKLPCCNVFHVRDGLVFDYRVYLDIGPVYA